MSASEQARTNALRVSPGGLITLPFPALRALGFGEAGQALEISVAEGRVALSLVRSDTPHSVRVSQRGVVQLPQEAHRAVTGGEKGQCKFVISGRSVVLQPAT